MSVIFKSFSSGSCGNCYFLAIREEGAVKAGVLVDAGVSLRRVKKELEAEKMSLDDFSAMLVTHDHLDHIRGLGSFCKKLRKPVWATKELHHALAHHTFTHEYIDPCRKVLDKDGWNEIVPGEIRARYFIVPHDASQTVGYAIMLRDYKVVVITDAGSMTREAMEYCHNADTVVIESNYDFNMLMHGPYTEDLKRRITGGSGHMSNDQCAEAIRKFWHPGLHNLFLCHLSENNNTPQLALAASRAALDGLRPFEREPRLVALPRQTPSVLFTLDL